MSSHTRHVTPLGPAPVAVHDDGDVFRELCRIQMPVDFDFLAVEPRGYGRSYFVVQSGHDMRLPQGGRVCNDRKYFAPAECGRAPPHANSDREQISRWIW